MANRGLTAKQSAFVDYYVQSFNATQAAIAAGYSERTAGSIGSENLTKPEIAAAIEERLKERQLTRDAILARLSDIALGDMTDALHLDRTYSVADIAKLRAEGKGHLIKSFRQTKAGTAIEFHDPLRALDMILRATGQYTDRTEHTGDVTFRVVYGDDGTDG